MPQLSSYPLRIITDLLGHDASNLVGRVPIGIETNGTVTMGSDATLNTLGPINLGNNTLSIISTSTGFISMWNGAVLGWSNANSSAAGAIDIGFARNGMGLAEVNNGTKGTFADLTLRNLSSAGFVLSISPTSGVGYNTGAGGSITQITSRDTGVTLNTVSGDIVLLAGINAAVSAATANTVVVTNSAVAITDTVNVVQKSGTDKYLIFVTNMASGSFSMTFFTTGGITNESPVFHFNVIKGVSS